MDNRFTSENPCQQVGQPHSSRCPQGGRSASPRCPSREPARPGPQCPPASSPGKMNLVKPQLETLLKITQFGMREFMEKRFKHLRELCGAINDQKDYLAAEQCVLEELEPVISNDLDTLPYFIKLWGDCATYFQEIYNNSCDPINPIPNLDVVAHPSPEICQETYMELVRSGSTLCLEVERGLRVIEIMYSKLDETIVDAQRKLEEIYRKITATETTAAAMGTDSLDWLRRFRELEHSLETFLSEWQRGGDHLNEPPAQLPPSPTSSKSTPVTPRTPMRPYRSSSPCGATPTSAELQQMTPYSSSSSYDATPTSAELQQGNERIAALRTELQAKESHARCLEAMIERYNALNTSIQQETQENINQQEILNQSLRAMDDLPSPNQSSSS